MEDLMSLILVRLRQLPCAAYYFDSWPVQYRRTMGIMRIICCEKLGNDNMQALSAEPCVSLGFEAPMRIRCVRLELKVRGSNFSLGLSDSASINANPGAAEP